MFSKISNLKANPWIESRALVCLFIFCVYLCPIYGKVGRADSAGFWSLRACRWCKNKSKLFSGSPDKLSPCFYVLYAYQMPLAFLVHNYIKEQHGDSLELFLGECQVSYYYYFALKHGPFYSFKFHIHLINAMWFTYH